MEHAIRRILIVRTDRIGDVILTLPMAHVLKSQDREAHIAMLISRYTAEIVEDNPDADEIIFYDDGARPIPLFRLVRMLRRSKFDVSFHTHPRFRLALVTALAGIPVRVGTSYRWYSFLFNRKVREHRKDARYHELEYNLHLLEAVGSSAGSKPVVPTLRVRPEAAATIEELFRRWGVRDDEAVVVIHPGSGGSARNWNPDNFGRLAAGLARLPHLRVIVTGGAGDAAAVDRVRSLAGEKIIAVMDLLTLREYAALAARATVFIANSTGPIHIAAAVGTRVVGLYSQVTSMSARRWGPYTEKRTIITPAGKPADCRICLRAGSTSCECMDTITVDEVMAAACRSLHVPMPREAV